MDVIILGGGPGGLSTAFWCAEFGLKAILFEKEIELGGQLLWTFNTITNYLGIDAITGRDLRDRFLHHIENKRVHLVTGMQIVEADLANKTVTLDNGHQISARSFVIATGVSRRNLGVPGEVEFQGRGILDSGARAKGEVAGKTVVIVGGGNAAIENAAILSESAGKVILVHRRDMFTARREFLKRLESAQNLDIFFNSKVTEIFGNENAEGARIRNILTGQETSVSANAILIRTGVEPNNSLFDSQLNFDSAGYLLVNNDLETNVPGVFAVGDIANPKAPTISSSVGMGARASRSIADSFA
ncbi:thioredoxin-disulfide reductase [soil metagenome]